MSKRKSKSELPKATKPSQDGPESYKICVIPDCQVKPGVPLDHLTWAGDYIADKRPNEIICIGDFADMESLSSYDKGKRSFEGRRYQRDIEVTKRAMSMLCNPFKQGKFTPTYSPLQVLLYGNHEERILRCIEDESILDGTISLDDLGYAEFGWECYPYLSVYSSRGINFSHYFSSGVLGRPVSSARALLTKKHTSAIMGHVQKRDIAYDYTADGKQITGIFVGTFYQHDESYLNPQTNKHWRGIWMLHNCIDGEFDEMPVSMQYLRDRYRRKYGTTTEVDRRTDSRYSQKRQVLEGLG
jgi:hypothetical protein